MVDRFFMIEEESLFAPRLSLCVFRAKKVDLTSLTLDGPQRMPEIGILATKTAVSVSD